MKINSCIISGATNESSPPNLIVLYTQITATAPFYSTQAMVEPTSVSQNNPYKLYTLSCHFIQLQCTRKRMHTSLLGRMPGPRRPIHVRLCIKKNQNAPILSEHPPVRRKIVKTFRWDQRLQIQKEKLERAYTFPSPGGKNVKTFRWERRLLLCYCKRRSASESEGITLGGAREVQKYSLSVWPFKARSLIIRTLCTDHLRIC